MSIADLSRRVADRRLQRGYTALEMVIVVALVALTTLVIERTISSVTDSERLMRAIRNTTERGQKAAYRLRDTVATSRRLFGNDTIGNGYLAKLNDTAAPRLAGSRLPKFDEVNPLGPDDVGDPRTGNVLLFVRESDPANCIATPATKKTRLIDTYRFVCLYLTQTNRKVVSGGLKALDLVEWRSDSFPSYGQVMGITNATEKQNVVKDLYNRFGFDYLWDSGAAVDSAFYGIDGFGNVGASPTVLTKIPEDLNVSVRGRFVTSNMAVARTDMSSKPREPVFTAEPMATWTPHGFEVKVAGPSGSRRVWMRLTIEQEASTGRVPAQQTTVVATTRDL